MNLNDYIKVKLTAYGKQIYRQHQKKRGFEARDVEADNEGFSKFQLYEFMNIFGSYMFNGSLQIIEDNNIEFDSSCVFYDTSLSTSTLEPMSPTGSRNSSKERRYCGV